MEYHTNQIKINLLAKITYNLRSYIISYLHLNDYLKLFTYNKQSQADIIKHFRFKGKTSKNKAVYYLKYFHLFNSNSRKYFFTTLYPLLTNADGVYELLTTPIYAQFLIRMKQAIDRERSEFILLFDWATTSLKKWFDMVITTQIQWHLHSQSIVELNFSHIKPTDEGMRLLILLIRNSNTIEFVDISNCQIKDNDLVDIINETYNKVGNFSLVLLNTKLSQLHLKLINSITDEDLRKKYQIDPLYKGMLKKIQLEHRTK